MPTSSSDKSNLFGRALRHLVRRVGYSKIIRMRITRQVCSCLPVRFEGILSKSNVEAAGNTLLIYTGSRPHHTDSSAIGRVGDLAVAARHNRRDTTDVIQHRQQLDGLILLRNYTSDTIRRIRVLSAIRVGSCIY